MPTKTTPKHVAQGRVPIIDLGMEYRLLKAPLQKAMERVLSSGTFIAGPELEAFEKELAAYIGVSHAVGVNSGTDAILVALRALDIGPGDEVIVPAMTFIATAEPVVLLGAKPVFADIDPISFTLSPEAARDKITPRTKAIVAVHLYGQSADMKALRDMARDRQITLIEDMAQAIGAEYQGRKVGTFGRMACVSFFPTKNLGAYGDGGAVLTSDPKLAVRLQKLRNHGSLIKYQHEEAAYNTRLDELQSAILRVKLPHLDNWNRQRAGWAAEYTRRLKGLPIRLPAELPGRKHVYHLYSICSPQRDALRAHLQQQGIATGFHYPTPLHLQQALRVYGGKPGDFPVSEKLAQETLSLPLYPQLTLRQVERVTAVIQSFF